MINTYNFLRRHPVSCIVNDVHLLMVIICVGAEIPEDLATEEFARFVMYESSDGCFRDLWRRVKPELLRGLREKERRDGR